MRPRIQIERQRLFATVTVWEGDKIRGTTTFGRNITRNSPAVRRWIDRLYHRSRRRDADR